MTQQDSTADPDDLQLDDLDHAEFTPDNQRSKKLTRNNPSSDTTA